MIYRVTLFCPTEEFFFFKKNGNHRIFSGRYSPTMRSIAPTRIPNMEVEAESIPSRI